MRAAALLLAAVAAAGAVPAGVVVAQTETRAEEAGQGTPGAAGPGPAAPAGAGETDPTGPEAVAAAAPAGAAPADPGGPEGAQQTARVVRDLDSYDLPIGRFGLDGPAVRPVEGTVAWSAWRLDTPGASVEGVMQGYRERLAALGFEPVFACAGEACGGFDFRFGAEILPPPGMLVDVRDFAQLSAAREAPEAFVSVLVSSVLGSIYVQTVSVSAPAAEAPVAVAEVPTVETAPETVILPQDERELLARLAEDGHVPVEGLDFGVGGAALSEGSAAALDMLARMLTRDDELSVAIVGHSDNQGGLELNLEVSQRRAEAVMQALIDRGVPPDQIVARGVAFLAPVASNRTEEGRARNRRVELVLR